MCVHKVSTRFTSKLGVSTFCNINKFVSMFYSCIYANMCESSLYVMIAVSGRCVCDIYIYCYKIFLGCKSRNHIRQSEYGLNISDSTHVKGDAL